MKAAIDGLHAGERTATGEGIYTALQAIATVGAVMGGGDSPPPARIVLESDGKETVPMDPSAPRGAYTAAQSARDQKVAISTISFGTPNGYVDLNGQQVPVPVDDQTLQKIGEITGGQAFHAGSLQELNGVYATLQQQIGYQTIRVAALIAGVMMNRRLPN
jgi:Ca-activated chloride channel family protein